MKNIYFLLIIFPVYLFAQQEDAWVYFTNKPDAGYYLDNPLQMLTQKALDRRTAQGIALDGTDVPIHQPYVTAVTTANGITVMAKSKWLNALHIRGSEQAINALTGLDFVQSIEFANKLLNTQGRPAVTLQQNKNQQTQENFSYGQSSTQVEMLNGHLLHQQGFTGTGVTIAVLDGGFPGVDTAQPFERLQDNNLILGGYNFVAHTDNFYSGGDHGTKVLATMGGYTEGQLVGTAPDAFYYLFVTEDVTSENPVEESYWVEAAEAADSLGVDVINTSLGYFGYDNAAYSHTYEDMDGQTTFITRGATIAFTRGMVCVTSAGNSGSGSNPNIAAPADAATTLTVGAVDAEGQYVGFSSIGPTFDGRLKPDVMARGQSAVISNADGSIGTASGTSFSSPITAGLVACLWQALPGSTNAQIIQFVKESADRFTNPDNQYGYGIPDFELARQLFIQDSIKPVFKIYPNPFSSRLSLAFPQDTDFATLLLYNNLGQLVYNQTISAAQPNVFPENLSQGIYSYTITSATLSQSGRLIKE